MQEELSRYTTQAALVQVRDRDRDYGYCGFYALRRVAVGPPHFLHFAFSDVVLGLGVETWLYRALNRPMLRRKGPVAVDPTDETQVIDWIHFERAADDAADPQRPHRLSHVLLRGACELRPLAHYFAQSTDRVIEEFDTVRQGQLPLVNHSVIASQVIQGIDRRVIADAAPLGYIEDDFSTFLTGPIPAGPAVWLFGFAIEQLAPLFRHKETGVVIPWSPVGLGEALDVMMAGGPFGNADPGLVAHLREKFHYVGRRPNAELDSMFRESLHRIFSRAHDGIAIFVVLASTRLVRDDGSEVVVERMRVFNELVAEIAGDYRNVELLAPLDFMSAEEIQAMKEPNHFDRIAYYRMFKYIERSLQDKAGIGTESAAAG